MWKYFLIPLLSWCCACSQTGRIVGAKPKDLPASQIVGPFQSPPTSGISSPISQQWRPGDDLELALIKAIDSAETEILMAAELTLPAVAHA